MAETAIEWATHVWNPVTGCDRVSPGCANCYALTYAGRLKAMGQPKYQRDGGRASWPGFGVTLHKDELDAPARWRKPRRVFVNSMSDLFHEEVPDSFLEQVFGVMMEADRHIFQVLTKRPERMREFMADAVPGHWPPPNVWLPAAYGLDEPCPACDRTSGDHTVREWAACLGRQTTDLPLEETPPDLAAAAAENLRRSFDIDGDIVIADHVVVKALTLDGASGPVGVRLPAVLHEFQVGIAGQPPSVVAKVLFIGDGQTVRGFVRPLRTAYRHETCRTVTTMNVAIAETYARQPAFYGATYCVRCAKHLPVGEQGEFVWIEPDGSEGPKVGT